MDDRAARLLELLQEIVHEFGCSLRQYDEIGPAYTLAGGTEVFEVDVLLDRRDLIEEASKLLALIAETSEPKVVEHG